MGPRGAAAVAVGLWVLVTAGEAADPGVTTPRRCLLSHYRSLDPRAVAAVKALRDRYVSDAQTSPPVPKGACVPAPSRRASDLRAEFRPRRLAGRPCGQHTLCLCARPQRAPPPGRLGSTSGRRASQGDRGVPLAHRAGLPRATGFSAPSAQPSPAGSVPRVGIPAFPALGERSEEAQPHPDPCPTGGGDPELEAAQLLLSRREGSSAALGEVGEPSGAPDPRISRAPARRWSCWRPRGGTWGPA